MIIFARAPGAIGWVEITPEEEVSYRGQFWAIRKFAVEQEDALPLARRLDRAEQALRAAGFKYHGPSEKWLAPKAPAPLGWWTEELTKIYAASTGTTISPDMVRAAGIALKVARGEIWDDLLEKWLPPTTRAVVPENEMMALLPGNCYLDEPDGGSVTVLEQFKRMAADAAKWRKNEEILRGKGGAA